MKDLRFLYDGWNMTAELDHTFATGDGLHNCRPVREFFWGPDLSGTMDGAGGVGGLVSMKWQGSYYLPCIDGNGNIKGWLKLLGNNQYELTARYDYDPFGNRITDTGPGLEVCPFGFSTKYRDEETGLLDYGYRFYDPVRGRWLCRDPIGERGGINLYGFVGNCALDKVDVLGQIDLSSWLTDNPGVGWQADPCTPVDKLERRYIQYMKDYAPFGWPQSPSFDGADGKTPFYPTAANDPFQDTPFGLNGSPQFEVCRACVCKATGKIMSVGPCINWTEADTHKGPSGSTTDLSALPTSRQTTKPSAEFMALLQRQFPELLDPRLSCMCGPHLPQYK